MVLIAVAMVLFQSPALAAEVLWDEHNIAGSFDAPMSVYATDVDGDGDIDVLGAGLRADDITWGENDGNENFTEHTIADSFDGARSVYAADVDGDGDVDVLGAAAFHDDITWWENDGSENFTKHTIKGDFDGAWSVYATDIDADGDIDVLGAARDADDITWWENLSESAVEATVDFDPDILNLKSGRKVGTSEISIEAYIDGRSLLIITENTVQWHHLDWAAPGRHGFVNLPTVINGMEWYPEWPDWPDEENRTECFSSVYEDLTPGLPESDIEVELEVTEARHSLSIVQHPSADNNYTLILDFNDNPIGGPAWYECELIVTWQTAASMHSKATVTVYIELPEGYDANDMDVSTILLNDAVSAKPKPVAVGDHDSDGISDLMVKFDRAAVQSMLGPGHEVDVTVSGELTDGTPFEGADTIRVLEKGNN